MPCYGYKTERIHNLARATLTMEVTTAPDQTLLTRTKKNCVHFHYQHRHMPVLFISIRNVCYSRPSPGCDKSCMALEVMSLTKLVQMCTQERPLATDSR